MTKRLMNSILPILLLAASFVISPAANAQASSAKRAPSAASQVFAVAGATPGQPTLGLSKQNCAASNYKTGMRAFVVRPQYRAVEACWNFTAGSPSDDTGVITVCVLQQDQTTAPLGDECYTLSALRFKEVQLPSFGR